MPTLEEECQAFVILHLSLWSRVSPQTRGLYSWPGWKLTNTSDLVIDDVGYLACYVGAETLNPVLMNTASALNY